MSRSLPHSIHRDSRNLPVFGRFHPRLRPLNSRFEPKQGMLQAAIMLHGGIAGGLITGGPLLSSTHEERASSALVGRSYETEWSTGDGSFYPVMKPAENR